MKHTKRFARFLAVFAAIACILATSVFAEETGEEDAGIPAYAIARLKVLAGTVWVRPADGGDWAEAPTNSPLTPNSRISVPEGSEGELQFHGGQFVLLTAGTDLQVQEMADDKTSFRIRAGEIRFDLPGDDFAPVNVRVPGGARTDFSEPGRYWITVTDDDETRLVVRRGNASVSHEGSKVRMSAGEEALIGRDVTISRYAGGAEAAPPPEQVSEAERSAGVPPVVGDELSEYGEWVQSPTYGYVWRPRVAVGWTPYVYGRWTWVVPYGWIWVSYEPWGWYPYHSGYWVTDPGFGWVWTPYGSFVSIGIGFDWGHHHHYHRHFHYRQSNVRFIPEGRNVRWVPLRPGDRYRTYRNTYPRGDARLTQWNRLLESGRIYMRPRGSAGTTQRDWRDVTVVRTERQALIRTAPIGGVRRDARPVRPELQRKATTGGRPQSGVVAPKSDRPAVQRKSGDVRSPKESTVPRVTTPRESAPTPRVTTPRESAPTPRVTTPRESAPTPRVTTPRESAPAPRVTTPRESAPAPRAAPSRERAPVREMEQAPVQQPGRSMGYGGGYGGGERGGGGSRGNSGGGERGGGDRGGGGRGDFGGGDHGGGRGGR